MSDASLTQSGDSGWKLAGVLDFASVPTLWPVLEEVLQAGGGVTLSLSDVRHANSAGLVMLLEARDLAYREGCRLRLVDVPGELLDLARMSGCDGLISENAI